MAEPVSDQLLKIARRHLLNDSNGTLVPRNSDSLDFHTASVSGIARALQEAYDAGLAEGHRPSKTEYRIALPTTGEKS